MKAPSKHPKRRVIKSRLSRHNSGHENSQPTPKTSPKSAVSANHGPDFKSLLTPIQTAELLGVTSGTLSVWRSTERYPLKYIKLGGLIRYRLSDVCEFLRSRTRPGVSDSAGGDL